MIVPSFLEPSKRHATNEEFIYTALLVKKKSAFAERNFRLLINFLYKYLQKIGHAPS